MTGYLTDGPIQNFTKGWAIIPFRGSKAHYWIQEYPDTPFFDDDGHEVRLFRSECGLEDAATIQCPALGPGNFPQCKRCLMALQKKGRTDVLS